MRSLLACDRTCSGQAGGYVPDLVGGSATFTPGVTSYTVSLEQQSVDVEASVPFETVLEKIKNTGKEVLDAKVIA